MPRLTKTILLLLLLFSYGSLFAQKHMVTGKVIDPRTGNGLGGASIKIKGSTVGVSSNNDGIFRLEAATGDLLEISMIGYKPLTVRVGSEYEITIKLEAESTELNQVVLVGTRRAGRVKTETPVPVDIVNVAQASLPTGKMDLTSVLNTRPLL